jgi:hypothetical protein
MAAWHLAMTDDGSSDEFDYLGFKNLREVKKKRIPFWKKSKREWDSGRNSARVLHFSSATIV